MENTTTISLNDHELTKIGVHVTKGTLKSISAFYSPGTRAIVCTIDGDDTTCTIDMLPMTTKLFEEWTAYLLPSQTVVTYDTGILTYDIDNNLEFATIKDIMFTKDTE